MSRNKKRQINWYQVNDGGAIAAHMEKMAAKGWFLEKAGQTTWTFRREEPRAVHYAVTYFPGASVFDGGPAWGQETYFDFCQAAGWEFVAAYGPIQYFRSERPDPVPIETDEREKLRSVHRTMLKTLVLGHALLLLSQTVWISKQWRNFRYDPLSSVSSPMWVYTAALFAVFFLYLAGILADYFIWYFRSKWSVARGGPCARVHTRGRLWCSAALTAFTAADVLLLLPEYLGAPRLRAVFLYAFIGILAVMALSRGVMWLLKRQGCSRGTVFGGFFVSVIVLSILYSAGMIPLASALSRINGEKDGPAYTWTSSYGAEWDIYLDELPVTMEDLGIPMAEEDHCSYRAIEQSSILASYSRYIQQSPNRENKSYQPYLYYTVCRIPSGALRDFCWQTLARGARYPGLLELEYPDRVDELPEGALEGRRDAESRRYALLYPDCIVLYESGWELTQAQLETLLGALR